MKILSFAIVLLCILVVIDVADCRRKRKRRKQTPEPVVPNTPGKTTEMATTTSSPSTTTELVVARACRYRVCEGDSHFLEDQCICGCDKGPGFVYNEQIGRCEDIDECEDKSNCIDGDCINVLGSYRCSCPPGYNLHTNGNLCLPEPVVLPCRGLMCFDGASLDEDRCRCKCRSGFSYDYFEEKCFDVDECAEEIDRCDHICVNTEGSYDCHCHPGFRLNYNAVSCNRIDPDCKDKAPFCDRLASTIECLYNPDMRQMCPKSCWVCMG